MQDAHEIRNRKREERSNLASPVNANEQTEDEFHRLIALAFDFEQGDF